MIFYNSDVHPFTEYADFAISAGEWFKERCMVGTVNMGYPANKATFGHLLTDGYPMMITRKAGIETKMLTNNIKHLTFELRPIQEWGYIINREQLGLYYYS